MRFAYADPPYPGQAKLYKAHPDYAGEVNHAELIERLEREFPDGWALSTSVTALGYVLSLCPTPDRASELRVCVWRRQPLPRPPARIMWSWEPLIVRTPHWRKRDHEQFVTDAYFACQPAGFNGQTVTGQKPVGFCTWLFELLGLSRQDEFVDLFPGSGAVTAAWEKWRAQTTINDLFIPVPPGSDPSGF